MTDSNLVRSIRAIGVFQYFASLVLSVASVILLAAGIQFHDPMLILVSAPIVFGLAVFYFLVARALRGFKAWARTTTMVVCCIGLFGIPFGTIVSGAFLYVLIRGSWDISSPEWKR